MLKFPDEQTILGSKVYQWTVGLLLVGYPVFIASILYFPIVLLLSVGGLFWLVCYEMWAKSRKRNWPRYVCWMWFIVLVPSFGIMPILIATRLHHWLPFGGQLGIHTGFLFSAIYDAIIPTPSLFEWDHPFPPISKAQLMALGVSTMAISTWPVLYLRKHGLWRDS